MWFSCDFIWFLYNLIWFSYDFVRFSFHFMWLLYGFTWFSGTSIIRTNVKIEKRQDIRKKSVVVGISGQTLIIQKNVGIEKRRDIRKMRPQLHMMGVSSDGLNINALPAARAGPDFQQAI